MAKSGVYCEHCGAVYKSFRRYCARCGRATSVTASTGGGWFFSRLAWPLQVLTVLLLFGGLGGGYYALGSVIGHTYEIAQVTLDVCEICGKEFDRTVKRITVKAGDPNIPQHKKVLGLCDECARQPVRVRTGEIFICRKCGAVIRDNTETIVMPRSEARHVHVKRTKSGLCDACRRTEELLSKHPNWTREAAELVARGEIAIGMNKEQALEAWGEPLTIEHISKGKSAVQKWVYGDRVLNIPMRDRFFLMNSGKVVHYEDPEGAVTRPLEHYGVPGK